MLLRARCCSCNPTNNVTTLKKTQSNNFSRTNLLASSLHDPPTLPWEKGHWCSTHVGTLTSVLILVLLYRYSDVKSFQALYFIPSLVINQPMTAGHADNVQTCQLLYSTQYICLSPVQFRQPSTDLETNKGLSCRLFVLEVNKCTELVGKWSDTCYCTIPATITTAVVSTSAAFHYSKISRGCK